MSWFGGFAGGLLAGYATIRAKRWPMLRSCLRRPPRSRSVSCSDGSAASWLETTTDIRRRCRGASRSRRVAADHRTRAPDADLRSDFLAFVTWLLIRWRRGGVADGVVLGRYFVAVGGFRFALEFLRVNVRVLGPLTVAHIFALGVVASAWQSWRALHGARELGVCRFDRASRQEHAVDDGPFRRRTGLTAYRVPPQAERADRPVRAPRHCSSIDARVSGGNCSRIDRPAAAPLAASSRRVNRMTCESAVAGFAPNQTPPAYSKATMAAPLATIPAGENPNAEARPANTSTTPPATSTKEPTRWLAMTADA